MTAGLRGAQDVVARVHAFLARALDDASVTPSSLDAEGHSVLRLLALAHALVDYLDPAAACELTRQLTALYNSLPSVRRLMHAVHANPSLYLRCPVQSSAVRLGFAVAFAGRLSADLHRRASARDPTLSSMCGSARLPSDTAAAWLASFPRVLWATGAQNAVAAAALVDALHSLARIALQPASPLALALRDAARQLAPTLYTVAVAHDGGIGCGIWGPFVDFPSRLQARRTCTCEPPHEHDESHLPHPSVFLRQERLISVLCLTGVLTPALRRALGVVARCPRVARSVRAFAAEVLITLACSQGLLEHVGVPLDEEALVPASDAHATRALDGLCAAVSLCLGRSVDASVDARGRVSVAPYAATSAGDAAGNTVLPAAGTPPGWGWCLEALCEGDGDAYDAALCSLARASSPIERELPPFDQARGRGPESGVVWDAVEAIVTQCDACDASDKPTELRGFPTLREAAFVAALYRLAETVSPGCAFSDAEWQAHAARRPSLRQHLMAAVSVLLVRGAPLDPCMERLLTGGTGGVALLWLEYAAKLVESGCAPSSPSAPELSATLRALICVLSAHHLVLTWRDQASAPIVAALASVATAARRLHAAQPAVHDAAVVVSLLSGSGLLQGD